MVGCWFFVSCLVSARLMECRMAGENMYSGVDFGQYISVESDIAASLLATADELAHTECFDQEQRAEIYAILQALQSDTENHRQTIKLLTKRMNEDIPHA